VTAEAARHKAAHPVIHATSALDGRGLPELRCELASLSRPNPLR